jgi:hypothetical protein
VSVSVANACSEIAQRLAMSEVLAGESVNVCEAIDENLVG